MASSQPEGSSRYEYFFRRLDANGDGRVDPKEVNGPAKMMVEGMARRAGLDPTKSISLTQFHEAMAKRMKQGGFGPGMPFFGTAEQGPSKDDASKTPQEEPLVPGFGLAQDLPPVPGFGVRVAGASPSGSNTSPQGKSKGASSSASDKSRTEYKVRAYAKGIIKKYDKNRSGALEKDEWGQMRTDPSPSDRNNDGVITKEELAARFMKDSKYAGSSSGSSSGSSGASRFASQKSYRFRTAMERLPDGLPDWFAGKDQNADGQVEMHEYASFWSDSTARQFAKYDLDNDGVITPAECLDAASREPESASVTKTETASVPESESDPKQKESSGGGFWWTR